MNRRKKRIVKCDLHDLAYFFWAKLGLCTIAIVSWHFSIVLKVILVLNYTCATMKPTIKRQTKISSHLVILFFFSLPLTFSHITSTAPSILPFTVSSTRMYAFLWHMPFECIVRPNEIGSSNAKRRCLNKWKK